MVRKIWLPMIVLALASCSGSRNGGGSQKHDIPVRVLEVSGTLESGTTDYVGTASASRSVYLSSRYPGRLVRLNVGKGDLVKAGDVIAEVESQTVVSSWEIAHSTLSQAEDGYERAKKVYENGSMSEVKMVEVETKLAQARASAAAADAAMEDCRIKAPFSGVIGDVMVTEGEELDVIDQVALLLDVSEVEIDFPVPEKELSSINKGDRVVVNVPALGKENVSASIISKGIAASPLSHTYECSARTDDRIDGLMPGMVVKVSIDCGSAGNVTVPASVIRSDMEGRYVWTVSDDNTVCKTYVSTGGFSGKGVAILEGLSPGDRVISEGVQKVCTGMKVIIAE